MGGQIYFNRGVVVRERLCSLPPGIVSLDIEPDIGEY